MTPRIRVDADACMASGTCVFHAPRTFRIDDEAGVAVVADPDGDPLERVLDAAEACPTQAISVERDAQPRSPASPAESAEP